MGTIFCRNDHETDKGNHVLHLSVFLTQKKAHIAQAPRQQFHFALNMYEYKCKLSAQVQKSFCRRQHPHRQKSDTMDDVSKMRATILMVNISPQWGKKKCLSFYAAAITSAV